MRHLQEREYEWWIVLWLRYTWLSRDMGSIPRLPLWPSYLSISLAYFPICKLGVTILPFSRLPSIVWNFCLDCVRHLHRNCFFLLVSTPWQQRMQSHGWGNKHCPPAPDLRGSTPEMKQSGPPGAPQATPPENAGNPGFKHGTKDAPRVASPLHFWGWCVQNRSKQVGFNSSAVRLSTPLLWYNHAQDICTACNNVVARVWSCTE